METAFALYTVTEAEAGQRLDVWLLARVVADEGDNSTSRAEVQRWIKGGFVRIGPELAANPAKKVRLAEVYGLNRPAAEALNLTPEDIPLDIVYEDDALLVLNKPVGLAVHPSPGHASGTLVHALLHHCGAALSSENGTERPGIVHRLDKDTSGLMVVAKTGQAHRVLARQFLRKGLDGQLERQYIALVRGVPMPKAGTVQGNIGRHPTLRIPRAVVAEGGKAAVTHYQTLETYGQYAALLALKLETGRTHQIRVHMAHKGHGVLGDPLYPVGGPRGLNVAGIEIPNRQMLHAAVLGFVHPISGQKLRFEAPLPDDIQRAISAFNAFKYM